MARVVGERRLVFDLEGNHELKFGQGLEESTNNQAKTLPLVSRVEYSQIKGDQKSNCDHRLFSHCSSNANLVHFLELKPL
jgi:hypothetical protein